VAMQPVDSLITMCRTHGGLQMLLQRDSQYKSLAYLTIKSEQTLRELQVIKCVSIVCK
jgi:hypothetical protein